ncbi:MAG TPA: GTPase ObgE [Thermoleophilaceae bacterium]|nr:GTPase ObgE [Thermoleophilaceae bacterium]
MLQDRARIYVQAGAGGNGSVSFRREAHVPRGGPDGGDGGRGADVIVVCDGSLRDLQVFRRRGHWKAQRGGHGEGSNRHGASPPVLEVRVPPGTIVEDAERGVRWDFTAPGQRAVVARGGSGGRGNKQFATPTRQAPRFAERGLAGEEGWLDLRLKLLADVGLVGLPNAGKSSLIARLTRAAPKIADYPFTTLEPVLGTLDTGDRQLVIADIPGLIEGASRGAGLGHEFLAHVERTRLLVHVLDLAPVDGSDPAQNFETVEAELRQHDRRLAALPRVLALSKADLVTAEQAEAARSDWQARVDFDVVVTSSATGQGLDEVSAAIVRNVPEEIEVEPEQREALAEHRVYRPGADDGYRVDRGGDGVFRVSGRGIDRLIGRHDIENEEALRYIEERLRTLGVIRALEAQGFEPGDDVEIAGIVFELDPGMPFQP